MLSSYMVVAITEIAGRCIFGKLIRIHSVSLNEQTDLSKP